VIRHACLVGALPDSGVPSQIVGGLPNLLRQVLSLQDAGIEVVTLVGVTARSVREDSRVKLSIRELPAGDAVDAAGPALVARAGSIWHPRVVRRLARTHVAADQIIETGRGDASIRVCGAERLAGIVSSLSRSALESAQSGDAAAFIILARTERERRDATRLLLRSLEKQADGFVSRHLHRRLSRAVTGRLLRWPITPNQMTMVAALFGIAGCVVAARGGYWNLAAGAALVELQNVLDGCDGEIARLKYLRSRTGEWLDQVVDDVVNIAFLASFGLGLAAGAPEHWARLVIAVAVAAQLIHAIGLYAGLIVKAGGRGSVAGLRWWVGGGTETDARSRLLGDLTRRDFYSLLYVVASVVNVPAVAFVWHATITVASAVVSTVQWIAWNGPDYQADADGAADPTGDNAA
jgi:phosphatidylglycerophosphate synthase